MNQPISPYGMESLWTRRRWLVGCGVGLLGLSLPIYFALRGQAEPPAGRRSYLDDCGGSGSLRRRTANSCFTSVTMAGSSADSSGKRRR